MRRLASAVVHVVGGGAYVSIWTLAVAVALSLTVVSPAGDLPPDEAFDGFVVSLIGALVFGLLLGLVAVLERNIPTPRGRATAVLAGVAVAAAARPLVQDAALRAAGFPGDSVEVLAFRVATNLIVWLVTLSVTALVVDAIRSRRRVNALLRSVRAELAAAQQSTEAYDRAARALVVRVVDDARTRLAQWNDPPTVEQVRAFAADAARAESHELADLAAAEPPRMPGELDVRRARLFGLRLPPVGLVGLVYLVFMLPYAVRAATPAVLVVGAVFLVIGSLATDYLPRRLSVLSGGRARAGVFLGVSVLAGFALSLASVLGGLTGIRVLIPALAFPLIAFAFAMLAAVAHALQVEQRRLSHAVASQQRALRRGTAPARAALTDAAQILHRDVQARCVLQLQTPSAGITADIDELLAQAADVFARPAPPVGAEAVDQVIATWAHVIAVDVRIDDDARAALDGDGTLARDAYDIVAEGLLNAVKHADARRVGVSVDLTSTGAGRMLRLAVRCEGILPRGAALRPASHVRSLGAELVQVADSVVLRALLVVDPGGSRHPVVSAVHPA
jgi:signal transduction histidine kinase